MMEIEINGRVKCPAFSTPILSFNECRPSESGESKWAKLARVILDYDTQIPLKEMCLKAKQEQLIYKRM